MLITILFTLATLALGDLHCSVSSTPDTWDYSPTTGTTVLTITYAGPQRSTADPVRYYPVTGTVGITGSSPAKRLDILGVVK
jgi:hypothetical protein